MSKENLKFFTRELLKDLAIGMLSLAIFMLSVLIYFNNVVG